MTQDKIKVVSLLFFSLNNLMKQASQILSHKKSPAKSRTLILLAESGGRFSNPVYEDLVKLEEVVKELELVK